MSAQTKSKSTDELLKQIVSSGTVTDFIADAGAFVPDLPAYLARLLDEKGVNRATVINAGDFNVTFGYQIFSGERRLSRDNTLRLALAFSCDLSEAQLMLKHAGHPGLYAKTRRDAIIIFALSQGWDLQETNRNLFEFGEDILETSRER